jgi:type VI protein secretion system component VasK
MMMHDLRSLRHGIAWLELLLALALIMLILQLVPSLGQIALLALDFRNWPRTVWFGLNIIVVALLLGIRFVPGLIADWNKRQHRLLLEKTKAEKVRKLKQKQETMARMQQSRRRRMY